MNDRKKELLRQIPKIDEVLNDQRLSVFFGDTARALILDSIRNEIDTIRLKIINGDVKMLDRDRLIKSIVISIEKEKNRSLKRVINATGTIIHTNLGRSGLSKEVCKNIVEVCSGSSNLEYDLHRGVRGSRYDHIEKLLTRITGAEAAMVVNNNAAAVLLCLSALAKDMDVVVSRGELVEIGGSFRIPEIMEQGGARLKEVGTTNKTNIADYENAVAAGKTGMLLKVHTSNYKIMGFTAEASLEELVKLGSKYDIPVVYDIGSGLLINLMEYGVIEPTVKESMEKGIDLIMFSGDKLLGGPQAGIITGKKQYIEKMKKHPMARVVRPDKMTLVALESTLREYLDPEKAKKSIPTLEKITASKELLKNKAERFASMLSESTCEYRIKLIEVDGQIGGGSAPNQFLPGYAVSVSSDSLSAAKIEHGLRSYHIPVIVRIYREQVLIDMRTVAEEELSIITDALIHLSHNGRKHNA